MKNINKLGLLFIVLLITGCSDKTPDDITKGKLRHTLFVECMELAAKMPRKGDDDVSDIVDECSLQSYYMASQMSK